MNMDKALTDPVEASGMKLRVLSVQSRLRVLLLLQNQHLCVGALAQHLGMSQGAVSQHLKVLREAGLVIAERTGYFVHYRINAETLEQWRHEINDLLKQLGEERADKVCTRDGASMLCKSRKENTCARMKDKATVRKDSM